MADTTLHPAAPASAAGSVPMRAQVTAHLASGLHRLRHPRLLGAQALLVAGWLLVALGDPITTGLGFTRGFGEGDGIAAAMMGSVGPWVFLAVAATVGLSATVLAAGRATTWWSKLLLTGMGSLAVVKLAAISWNIHLLVTYWNG